MSKFIIAIAMFISLSANAASDCSARDSAIALAKGAGIGLAIGGAALVVAVPVDRKSVV